MNNPEESHFYPIRTSEGVSFHEQDNDIIGVELRDGENVDNVLLFTGFKKAIKSKNPLKRKPEYYDIPLMRVDSIAARNLGAGSMVDEYYSEAVARVEADELIIPGHAVKAIDVFEPDEYKPSAMAEGIARLDRETIKKIAKGAGASALAAGVVGGIIYLARRQR